MPPANYIDELVNAKLQKLRILPSDICSDPVFLRRATIDITGVLPTEDEYRAFLDDKSPDKRAKLVDRLLERKAFAEIWAMKWAELLMVRSGGQTQISYKSIYPLFHLAHRADRRQRAAGPDRPAVAGRPRRHVLVAGRPTSTRSSATR